MKNPNICSGKMAQNPSKWTDEWTHKRYSNNNNNEIRVCKVLFDIFLTDLKSAYFDPVFLFTSVHCLMNAYLFTHLGANQSI